MTEITKSIYLNAAPDIVWDYLTQPDKLAIWFHRPETPLTQGAPYTLFGTESGKKLVWGEVLVARRPKYLEYSFTIEPLAGAMTTVAWTLEPVEGGTHLSLRHTGMPAAQDGFGLVLAIDKGWEDHMARMRADLHELVD